MVHKKYIKRNGKVFGPYLYENYRENGKVKTRYIGKGDDFGERGSSKRMNSLVVLGIVALIFILILLGGFFIGGGGEERGFLFSEKGGFFQLFNQEVSLFQDKFFSGISLTVEGNHPPVIMNVESEISICENERLRYFFDVLDEDGLDNLNVLIIPPNPFFVNLEAKKSDKIAEYKILSGVLDERDINRKRIDNEGWATYREEIIASDGIDVDSVVTDITIIEVNDAPNLENIGAKTIWTKGDNRIFEHQLNVTDEEDGNATDGILELDLSFLNSNPLFDLTDEGFMYLEGGEDLILEGNSTIYSLRVCVKDSGLNRIVHSDINFCLPDDTIFLEVCDDFSLTVTRENRAPRITDYYPTNNFSFNVRGDDSLYFNVSVYDADGTLPDVDWYVGDKLIEHDENNSFNEFVYSFGCKVEGDFIVKAFATDGELNDSVEWNFSVSQVSCNRPPLGGGGGGGGFYCNEEWVCDEWLECNNLKTGFEKEEINGYFERLTRGRCDNFSYSEENCGYQIRECIDIEDCKTKYDIPGTIRECYYTENPTCSDGIKNCHGSSCEVLVDCGGPCQACPTCEDKIKNQGEMNVDCGGPCSPCIESPFRDIGLVSIMTSGLLFLVLIVFIYFIIYEIKRRKMTKEELKKTQKRVDFGIQRVYFVYGFVIIGVILLLVFGGFLWDVVSSEGVVINIGEGFLGTQSLFNGFLRNFAEIFSLNVIESIVGTNADLVVWDDTDNGFFKYTEGTLYGKIENDWMVYFYADYRDKNGNPINSGNGNGYCEIKFYDGGFVAMNFNSVSGLWEYGRSFNDKGNLGFEVNCVSDYETLNIVSDVEILNTPPQINLNLPVLDIFIEDRLVSYDFSQRVKEDDFNDVLSYSLKNVSGENPALYDWITVDAEGLIFVNASSDTQTGVYEMGIEVSDSNSETVSRIQTIRISSSNDAPVFVGLVNQSFNAKDLFNYEIFIDDEENNIPFNVSINFMSCNNEAVRGNCTLFTNSGYMVNRISGFINISFTPALIDIGEYIINFSVTDNNSLGNKTTSELIGFSVVAPIWKEPLILDYNLEEDAGFYLDLKDMISSDYLSGVSFSYENGFSSFSLTSDGIIAFVPIDDDVGFYSIRVVASSGTDSPKIFNFNITNVHDGIRIIRPLTGGNVFNIDQYSNMEVLENAEIYIYLFADDDDLKIPHKYVYDEELNVDLKIEGVRDDLFEFVFNSLILESRAQYNALFIPRDADVGEYEIAVNVSDKMNNSDFLQFNITVINRDYDKPNITYPEGVQFNLVEGVSSNLVFRANHSVGDDLVYKFYVDGDLRYEANGPGNNNDFVWSFTPNYEDETYGEIGNLTLVVLNRFFSNFNDTESWNLSVKHGNAPVEFIRDIGDKLLPYTYSFLIDLKDYFSDADYWDVHYNQSVIFNFSSNSSPSYINVGPVLDDWTVVLSSSKYAEYSETLSITASDLNMSNESQILTSATSNYFVIEFIEPPVVTVLVPTAGGGGGGGGSPISLKIIIPGEVSAYEGEEIDIPLMLVNNGQQTFRGLTLKSSAFKEGEIAKKVETSLDREYIKTLDRNDKENITLTVFFGTNKTGRYEILVNVSSESPRYQDWAKIHVNLERINESKIRELIVFTEEFIVQNPECIEIKEVINEARKSFDSGDIPGAKIKAEDALDACKESISQVSVPKKKTGFYELFLYLLLACIIALVTGLIYYYFMRARFMTGKGSVDDVRKVMEKKVIKKI